MYSTNYFYIHIYIYLANWFIKVGVVGMAFSPFSITLSTNPYSTASWGCKYLTREQSLMTLSTGLPHALAINSHIVRRLCATSCALMAISLACPCACDFG
mmetsp:Transcript_60184/g.67339  ORF Transcript_60184/g.67339 Transcript_60184/m.67339 type:complete len:100 (-) Transcript_60184:663-962(-)